MRRRGSTTTAGTRRMGRSRSGRAATARRAGRTWARTPART
uniref:Uncharacterized protein n=1 Tax=Arundo donax TaxID=35708 RepID=A0A0A8XQK7_ARUDO